MIQADLDVADFFVFDFDHGTPYVHIGMAPAGFGRAAPLKLVGGRILQGEEIHTTGESEVREIEVDLDAGHYRVMPSRVKNKAGK